MAISYTHTLTSTIFFIFGDSIYKKNFLFRHVPTNLTGYIFSHLISTIILTLITIDIIIIIVVEKKQQQPFHSIY